MNEQGFLLLMLYAGWKLIIGQTDYRADGSLGLNEVNAKINLNNTTL